MALGRTTIDQQSSPLGFCCPTCLCKAGVQLWVPLLTSAWDLFPEAQNSQERLPEHLESSWKTPSPVGKTTTGKGYKAETGGL